MNHVIEIAVASVVITAATVGTMFIMPRPKPAITVNVQSVDTQSVDAQAKIERALAECKRKAPDQVCVVQMSPPTTEQKQIQDVRLEIKTVSDRAARIEKLLDEEEKKK